MSLQVVIGLCKRKETAALKSKPPFQMDVSNCLLYDGFFSFAVVWQSIIQYLQKHRNIKFTEDGGAEPYEKKEFADYSDVDLHQDFDVDEIEVIEFD